MANSIRTIFGSFLAVICTSVCLLGLTTSHLLAVQNDQFGKPSVAEQQATIAVARLMQSDHLLSRPLDDTISQRAMGLYLKSLDPAKVYFLKSDAEEFQKNYGKLIDDTIVNGEFEIAFSIFNRFLKRVDQATEIAMEALQHPHDFTIDEEIATDSDLIDYSADETELRDRWRKRMKYNLLVQKGDKKTDEEAIEQLQKRYRAFAKRMHQTDTDDVIEMYVSAMTMSYDPHTSYMSKNSFENFEIAMRLQLEGIGATLGASDDGYTVIKRIVPDGPADLQGELQVEDKILQVGQSDEEMVDVIGMKLDDVVQMIRGKAGTIVRLGVLSEKAGETKNITIIRDQVDLEDEAANGEIFEEGEKSDGRPYRIGVIDLPSFYSDMDGDSTGGRSTTTDVEKILMDFREQDVDCVVLDLRRNGGGSLREAINCTGLFVDSGVVVQVKDSYGQIDKHFDTQRGMSWDKPLVVLTSKFSASASEILAGAVKDYERGLIVGDTTTHGKGTVQTLFDLNRLFFRGDNPPKLLGALKITVSQFYRPNGDSTQKRGVFSDIVLPSITDKMDVAESDLDFAVEFDRISAASYKPYGKVSTEMIERLAGLSQARVQSSEEFAKEIQKIDKYVEYKTRGTVSLNEEKFNARRKEFDAEKEDEKAIEQQLNRTSKKIERDHYLNEALRIAVDYVNELKDG